MNDTEALKALVAKWRNGPPELSEGARKIYCDYRRGCADELEVLVQRLLASPDANRQEPVAWLPIETAPSQKIVLIFYTNASGKGRMVKARYVPRFTEESFTEFDEGEVDEYCETKDAYTLREGWYEQIDNCGDFSEVSVHAKPSHWREMPAAPETTVSAHPAPPVATEDAIMAAARDEAITEKYHQLIMAVVRKFPNETRHETALRYIHQAEEQATSGGEVSKHLGERQK